MAIVGRAKYTRARPKFRGEASALPSRHVSWKSRARARVYVARPTIAIAIAIAIATAIAIAKIRDYSQSSQSRSLSPRSVLSPVDFDWSDKQTKQETCNLDLKTLCCHIKL